MTEQNNYLVSIVIPVYNREHLILNSINSVLSQSYKKTEIIIVDDASTDKTEDVVREINDSKIKYYKQSINQGPSAARNFGVQKAQGELIAFLDSDDEWYFDKLEKQVNILTDLDDSYAAVFCNFETIDFETKEKLSEGIFDIDLCENFISGNQFLTPQPSTMLIKTEAFKKVLGYDIRLKANEDTELAIKLCKKYKLFSQKEVLVKVTRNHESLMGNSDNYAKAREIIIDAHKNYLSKNITFRLARKTADYHLMTSKITDAKRLLWKAVKIKPYNIKTIIKLLLVSLFPNIMAKRINSLYKTNAKFNGF